MRVLGIETSCDETAAAVVTDEGEVLAEAVSSQVRLHAPYGGIVPELAARAHLERIGPVVAHVLERAGGWEGIDAIAATQGPGLVGSLLVGFQFAKALAWARALPFAGVDHLEAHLAAIDLREPASARRPPSDGKVTLGGERPERPFVALLVSGGHTALYRVDDEAAVLLGQTRDDAVGEAYDKVAHLLGLGYPGGPPIDRRAERGDPERVALPRPMQGDGSLDFSFAGLKTAVALWVAQQGGPEALDERSKDDLCASFQRAAVEVLVHKLLAAAERQGVRDVVLTGGVAANRGLRRLAVERCERLGLRLWAPPLKWCTDNAAMVAYQGARLLRRGHRTSWRAAAYPRDALRRRGRFPQERCVPRPEP